MRKRRETQPRRCDRPILTMTHTALSDCSYSESTAYDIRDEIDAIITKLKALVNEEASFRKELRILFTKRREEAIERVRLANLHLNLVNEEEAAFCEDLKQTATIANEVGIEQEVIVKCSSFISIP